MREMHLVHAEVIGGDHDDLRLKFNAIKEGDVWYLFVAARTHDYWILMGEYSESASTIALTREWALRQAKWAVLYGDPWEDVYDDPTGRAADHVNAIESLGENMAALMDASRLEDILDWRRELERELPTGGELMREQLTGVPLLAGRN